MEKKSVSATVLVIFVAIFFSIIGVCFSMFVYKDTKIVIQKVGIVTAGGISVYSDEKLTKPASELKLSKLELGMKPATGEVDAESQVPSTIDDKGTSEGYFAKVYVKAGSDFKIVIKDVKINTKKDQIAADEQKKNIFISLKGIEKSTKSLEKDNTEVASFKDVSETLELTVLIWLGSFASDDLEGAKITFNLEFQAS